MLTQLSQFGLTANEQTILLHLFVQGTASALEIAAATRIKRPTVYLALDSLIEAGLVTRRLHGRRAVFESLPGDLVISTLVERARAKLRVQEQCAQELTQLLAGLTPKQSGHVGGLLVESLATERGLYREMYHNLLRGNYCGIFNPQLAVNEKSKNLLIDFMQKTASSKPHIREIAVAGTKCDWYRTQVKNPNHKIKLLPSDTDYVTDLILTEGYVVLLDYSPASRAAVKIKQANLFRSFSAIFDDLWGRCGD